MDSIKVLAERQRRAMKKARRRLPDGGQMTNRLFSMYAPGHAMTITLSKDFEFEAAQSLPQFPAGHKCRQIHGHSFKVTISVRGPVDEATGIFYDHAVISDVMRPIIRELDHRYLNDIPGLGNPTIELMSRWLWQRLAPQLAGLYEIVLHETPRARCVYRGD